jgi:hypothetical protein
LFYELGFEKPSLKKIKVKVSYNRDYTLESIFS